MKNQKASLRSQGFVQILLIGGVILALAVLGYVFYFRKLGAKVSGLPSPNTGYSLQQTQPSAQIAPVQNANDLNKVSASLDAQDTTQIDSQLNQLNSASSGF